MLRYQRIIFGLIALLFFLSTAAQQTDTISVDDTSTTGFLQKIRKFGQQETINSIQKYQSGRIVIQQQRMLQEIHQASERARILLKNGIDTSTFSRELKETAGYLEIVDDGIFVNKGSGHTTRNLTVSAVVLNELFTHTQKSRSKLSDHINSLVNLQNRIDSLSADSSLYTFPLDSAGSAQYLKKMFVVARELAPTDSALRKTIISLQEFETAMDLRIFDIRAKLEDIQKLRADQIAFTFKQEFPHLWVSPGFFRPFGEILHYSIAKEKLALSFYIKDYSGRILLLILLILCSWYFLHSLREKWLVANVLSPDFKGQLVIRYPILSAIIIVVTIFQFIFLKPPFIFSFFLWMSSAICLTTIFTKYITPFWMRYWIVMMCFFILAWADNMLLQASRSERWFMLGLSLAGIAYSIYILRHPKRKELREKGLLYFILFVIVMEAAASVFNVFGRYNLSKTLMIAGFSGMLTAILFLWTVRLINEGLSLTTKVYKRPERKLFYINFERVGEKAPAILYIFLVVGWVVLAGRNFYVLEQAAEPVMNFMTAERTLGSYSFTISSIFIFLLILLIAALLSQVISFFATEPEESKKDGKERKPGLGSWLLLVRIFILTLGLFLAFAAAGIPVDKLTIILGALGVGIGLGLQGLVSNLVSGLIIAFEQPVNVGDAIEVNGKPGVMKAIGFRSSTVTLAEGASLIIPNSDLLSQHLINWSIGKRTRRITITVNVAYESDLSKVKQSIEEILREEERVLTYPHSVVAPRSFQAAYIEVDVLFWLNEYQNPVIVKGDLITKIEGKLKEQNIVFSSMFPVNNKT